MAENNAGMWLDRSLRTGACGTWWSGTTGNGQPLALLQLDPGLIAQSAVQDRVAATVAAVRAANPRGVLRTTELVVEARRAWLVVAGRPMPTLDDLLSDGPALAPGAAAGIAVDVAEALRELHAVGISHSDLAPDTIVVTPAGAARLVEVGVLAAARGRPTDIGEDVRAWSGLAQSLAAATSSAAEADLLSQAAAVAGSGDLATAARRLAAGAAQLPDFVERQSLSAALPSAKAASRIPAQRSTVDDEVVSPVRIRFGPGVPDVAIAAALAERSTVRRGRPRRSRRTRQVAVAALALLVLLLAGGATLLALTR
jgi:tRNA A-37 threonylcarbamoyl transferase component Bud32